jgi:hypothetical protein
MVFSATLTVSVGRSIAQRTMSTLSSADRKRMAQTAFRIARAVCFDVDSTVITCEAIDEFAAFANKKEEVAALTAQGAPGRAKRVVVQCTTP